MKKIILFSLLFCLKVFPTIPVQESFLQGNQHFLKGQFDQAIACYDKINDKNFVVWQNLGNCYFNQNDIAKAVVCWRRAHKGAGYRKLRQLLEAEKAALQKISDQAVEPVSKVHQFLRLIPKLLLQLLLFILLLSFIFMFYKYVWHGQGSLSSQNKATFGLLLLAICLFFGLIIFKEKVIRQKLGVVMQSNSSVYVGPETTFSQRCLLHEGVVVQIVKKDSNMYKIVTDQDVGWIHSDLVEVI